MNILTASEKLEILKLLMQTKEGDNLPMKTLLEHANYFVAFCEGCSK